MSYPASSLRGPRRTNPITVNARWRREGRIQIGPIGHRIAPVSGLIDVARCSTQGVAGGLEPYFASRGIRKRTPWLSMPLRVSCTACDESLTVCDSLAESQLPPGLSGHPPSLSFGLSRHPCIASHPAHCQRRTRSTRESPGIRRGRAQPSGSRMSLSLGRKIAFKPGWLALKSGGATVRISERRARISGPYCRSPFLLPRGLGARI